MNATQIDTTYKAILRFVSASRLKPAFDRIKIMIDDLQYGEFSDRFNELERNYKFLGSQPLFVKILLLVFVAFLHESGLNIGNTAQTGQIEEFDFAALQFDEFVLFKLR